MVVLDVVEDILSRLLVKDLLLCKSVCKSWYSMISSPSFVETHRNFMCDKEDINTRRIAMFPREWGYESSRPPKWGSYHLWDIGGSSHGLVCMYTEDVNRIIVTNPLTGEFRELANPPDLPGPRHPYWRCMGFGYDSSTDDYKVVRAICDGDITLVHMLSLKSNIWKLFGQIKYRPCFKPGILLNGALHWFWFDANDTNDEKILIVSFDLAKEEFREIPQPDDSRYVYNDNYSLGLIEGSLCIFIDEDRYDVINCCKIWVMKNYNGNPSWEVLPIKNYCEMKDQSIHYMLKDTNQYRKTLPPTYYCDDNIRLSRSEEYISSPIFVQTLVSPYVINNNNNGRPSHTKNNKSTVSTGRSSHAKNNKSTVKVWRVKGFWLLRFYDQRYIASDCDAIAIMHDVQGYSKLPEDVVAVILKQGWMLSVVHIRRNTPNQKSK
ncbi:putative F-box domain-containing protein [Tanacetum coccineum]